MLRILTAAILLPILWATVKVAPPIVFALVALVVTGLACWECLEILVAEGGRPFRPVAVAASLAMVWSFSDRAPRFGLELPLLALIVASVLLAMRRRADPREMMRSATSTLFPALLVGLGLAFVAGLRVLPGEAGEDLLMLLFVCVFLADVAAFYVGSWIGKRALAPLLSPKKSWEGAFAGMLASLLGALIAQAWFYRGLPLGHALALGLVLGLAAVLGDLAVSMVKRAGGVKDASRLLPGHGGLLDRIDSLLFAGPLLYYYYRWFLQEIA